MEFLNYQKSVIEGYYIGYVAISFRAQNPSVDSFLAFVLNSQYDNWFRRVSGISKGHGLCIRNIKLTSKNPSVMGDFLVYKCKIDYINNNFESDIETDLFWLYVHKKFDVEDILKYIEENKENWKP